jgi:hypothetical protein
LREILDSDYLLKISQFTKCMYWLKRFLPYNTIITEKPDDPININEWCGRLGVMAKTASKAAVNFCSRQDTSIEIEKGLHHRPLQANKRRREVELEHDNRQTRKKRLTSSFTSMFKRLNTIRTRIFPVSWNTSDRCTPPEYNNIQPFDFDDVDYADELD